MPRYYEFAAERHGRTISAKITDDALQEIGGLGKPPKDMHSVYLQHFKEIDRFVAMIVAEGDHGPELIITAKDVRRLRR